MARRVSPEILNFTEESNGFSLTGRVSNFKDKAWHHRHIHWNAAGILIVKDKVLGSYESAQSYLHLHPNSKLISQQKNELLFKLNSIKFKVEFDIGCEISEGWYCPQFYIKQKNSVLCWQLSKGSQLTYKISLI